MDRLINFSLLRHPMNWLIITLMVLIVGIAVHLVLQYQAPNTVRNTIANG